jgi:hypothetical protein
MDNSDFLIGAAVVFVVATLARGAKRAQEKRNPEPKPKSPESWEDWARVAKENAIFAELLEAERRRSEKLKGERP